jgi:hypothetical protein
VSILEDGLTLKVMEASHRDIGVCNARLNSKDMSKLGLHDGDSIRLEKEAIVGAYVLDGGRKIKEGHISMDGLLRKNCMAPLDTSVKVIKTNCEAAKSLTLTFVSYNIDKVEEIDRTNIHSYLHSLDNLVFLKHEGKPIPLKVVDMQSETDIATVNQHTIIQIIQNQSLPSDEDTI